jgi:signal transduction histidine kinase
MRPLRDIPIKQKLLVIIMVTTTAALLLAGIGIIGSDALLFRRNLNRDLSALASIAGDNSTAALAFNDPRTAAETLGALRARTHVAAACIYRLDGSLLATYARTGASSPCPPADARDEVRSSGQALTISHAISLSGRRIGTLMLLYDLGELNERMTLYGAVVFGMLLLSSLLAFLLSSRLRAVITTPIAELVAVTRSVSQTNDYALRAQKLSGDELGELVDGFNAMLAGVQSKNDTLTAALHDREAALRAARTARDELRRANEDLQQFAYSASHDLQEPIRNVAVYSEIVAQRYQEVLDADGQQFLGFLKEGGRRLATLINDLLAFTRAGAGETTTSPADASQVLTHVLASLAEAIRESNATVTAGPLPEVGMSGVHLQQVLQNLLSNAVKYRGDAAPRIHITASHHDAAWRFSVQDNGIGIDPQYKETIFGVFKRLHRDQKYSGTGIGLAICQRVVERYGGRIWVDSSPGKGATFYFTVPEAAARSHAATADTPAG